MIRLSWSAALVALTAVTACDLRVRVRDARIDSPGQWKGPGSSCTTQDHPCPGGTSVALGAAPPALGQPKAFEPPTPTAFQTTSGLRVLLLERSELPLVSATFVLDAGAAADPVDKPGLASLTLDMMDEGAGQRDALGLSNAVLDLGATLSTGATYDGSFAAVSSLKSKFAEAFSILCDVVARPKLGATDYGRVVGLWKNALKKRRDEPAAVASLVASRLLYGGDSAYGHPVSGTLQAAERVTLDDVKRFHRAMLAPERLTLVVVGQISRAEIEAMLDKHLALKAAPAPTGAAPVASAAAPGAAQTVKPRAERPGIAVVDKKDAVQSVILVAGEGTRVADEDAPLASLVNVALGGSFTSRLNLNLREEKGWTYGVRSGFTEVRGKGLFSVRTSVETPVTGKAVAEILKELRALSDQGISNDELVKVRAQDRADLVELYETTASSASRFASLASLGLPPQRDAAVSRLRQAATLAELNAVAKRRFDPAGATVVVVGDRKAIVEQLGAVGLTELTFFDAEGRLLDASGAPVKEPTAKKPADGGKPAEKKPAEKKPAEKKPSDAKPAEKKPAPAAPPTKK